MAKKVKTTQLFEISCKGKTLYVSLPERGIKVVPAAKLLKEIGDKATEAQVVELAQFANVFSSAGAFNVADYIKSLPEGGMRAVLEASLK